MVDIEDMAMESVLVNESDIAEIKVKEIIRANSLQPLLDQLKRLSLEAWKRELAWWPTEDLLFVLETLELDYTDRLLKIIEIFGEYPEPYSDQILVSKRTRTAVLLIPDYSYNLLVDAVKLELKSRKKDEED